METKKVKLSDLKLNPDNPRFIRDNQFKKLVQSIKQFPKMLELREIIVDENMVILGGNMRFRALQELGEKTAIVKIAKDLTEEEKREFIIKDNLSFGEWEHDLLSTNYTQEELSEWGLDLFKEDNISNLEDDKQNKDSKEVEIKEQYNILIELTEESKQLELIEKLENEGYKCRALIS